MSKIVPFLWFNDQAEEAARFYVSIFPNSKILDISYYGEGSAKPAGTAMVVEFTLNGQTIRALNGGPEFKFSEAFSFSVDCETQEEVDLYWHVLTKDGEEVQCGWLKDEFGFSWQIVPALLGKLISDPDREKADRVVQALLKMKKLEIAELQRAYDGLC